MIYGYARISRPQQSIDRQIRNIKTEYPDAIILCEAYTGTRIDRPEWNKLYKKVKAHDTIVFDSVSRMSRDADEGIETYFKLYEKGVQLIFLKEHYIDTSVYAENMRDKIELQGTDEDEIFKGLNNYFRRLAVRQIRIAFEQSEAMYKIMHIARVVALPVNLFFIGCPVLIFPAVIRFVIFKYRKENYPLYPFLGHTHFSRYTEPSSLSHFLISL